MDLQKKEYVIDLIKKSLSLGIDEKDIVDTLVDANLTKSDAEKLISEAKQKITEKKDEPIVKEKVSDSKKVFDENTSKLSIGDQITMQLGLEVKEKKYDDEKIIKKQIEKDDSIKMNDDKIGESSKKPSDDGKKSIFSRFKKNNESEKVVVNNPIPKKIDFLNRTDVSQNKVENNLSKNDLPQSNLPKTELTKNDFLKEHFSNSGDNSKNINQNFSQKDFVISENKNDFKKNSFNENSINSEQKTVQGKSIEDLWKKGIVVAVNSRLNEMKKIRDDIDKVVSLKVDDAVKKETGKFKILLESQKDLIISSNKDELEQKQKEISFIIDSKLAEIRKESQQLNKSIEQINKSKIQQEELIVEINKTLEGAKKTKSQLLIEMNSELIKSKSQAQEFIDNAKTNMEELDSRINKTLEFEKNIAEGMLQEAEQKIENLTIQKADDLLEELELKLNNLKSIEKNIDLESIEQKIKILDQFKKEFLNNMEENIEKINKAIKKLNDQNDLISREIDEKVIIIDAKIEELTKFEKNLANNIEKIFLQKKEKNSKKNN